MSHGQLQAPRIRSLARIAVRVVLIFVAVLAVGTALNFTAAALERDTRPAGFGRGLLQGALMPMSLPNLLVGRDVAIYAQNNTGVGYKLGYTAGVNVCGAVFFGALFWRVWRGRKVERRTENRP